MKTRLGTLALVMSMTAIGPMVFAQDAGDEAEKADAALAKALPAAKVTLEAGLAASAARGRPISGKFEIEDGKLQLSVYTEKGGKFFEEVVDLQQAKVDKSEAITAGDDLEAAKSQSAAMAKAKHSLHDAVAKAVSANPGYRAISAFPEIKDGLAIATVTLDKGQNSKTVSEPLN